MVPILRFFVPEGGTYSLRGQNRLCYFARVKRPLSDREQQ